jgi:hypothetical protein
MQKAIDSKVSERPRRLHEYAGFANYIEDRLRRDLLELRRLVVRDECEMPSGQRQTLEAIVTRAMKTPGIEGVRAKHEAAELLSRALDLEPHSRARLPYRYRHTYDREQR